MQEVLENKKKTLVTTLHQRSEGKTDLPSISNLMNCTREAPLNWSPVLRRTENQSEDSCNEQCQASIVMTNRVMMQKSGLNTKNACLAGPPGSGKTF